MTSTVNAAWRTLLRVRDLCLFRAGPQDLPYAPRALVVLLIIGALLEAFFDLRQGSSIKVVIAANLGTLAALGALLWLLRWRHKPERFVQTALALLATGLLFEVLVLPLLLYVGHPTNPAQVTSRQFMAAMVLFVILIWQAGISVNILRNAMQIPVAGGVLALLFIGFVDVFATVMLAAALGAS